MISHEEMMQDCWRDVRVQGRESDVVESGVIFVEIWGWGCAW